MGGIRFEDYRVTNPKATFITPGLRTQELTALGPGLSAQLCVANPIAPDIANPPTISYVNAQTSIVEANYSNNGAAVSEEILVSQFNVFSTSDGFSSPSFGLKVSRVRGQQIVQIAFIPGNPGLQNIPGFVNSALVQYDPVADSVVGDPGPFPSSIPLRRATIAVAMKVPSILAASAVTVTPASTGQSLWSAAEVQALGVKITAALVQTSTPLVPVAPKSGCVYHSNGYPTCNGDDERQRLEDLGSSWGGDYLAGQTKNATSVLLSNMGNWAKVGAPLLDPLSVPTDYTYATMELTKPFLAPWSVLRDDPVTTSAQRALIDNWIDNRLVSSIAYIGGDATHNPLTHNWAYFSRSITMANGIRKQDDVAFARGVEIFFIALNQMRADGSFPLESGRGQCSASYLAVDLLHLVSIAEIAAAQGFDLYSLSVNGKRLETAIQFLLDARENPALLNQYAPTNSGPCYAGKPGDPADFTFFNGRQITASLLAWVEPYIARFPNSANAVRIRKLFAASLIPPRPLSHPYSGGNASCLYYKPYEAIPITNPALQLVSGNNQLAPTGTVLTQPLKVRLAAGATPLAGVLVNFALTSGSARVSQGQVLTDATGTASTQLTIGDVSGPVTVTANALGLTTPFTLTGLAVPAISPGGVASVGGSVPAITTVTPGSLFSIYGRNFTASGTGRRVTDKELVNNSLPTNLIGVCVSVGGLSAPMLDVYPGQINAITPAVTPGAAVDVIITTGCLTPNALASSPQKVQVTQAAPEFLYFKLNSDGRNPVAAVNSVTGAYIGQGAGFSAAKPGDYVTVYGVGFGATNPAVAPGATSPAAANLTAPYQVSLGGVALDPSDILYAGAAPGQVINQLNIRIPANAAPGKQTLQIQVGGVNSPPGAYLTIGTP